MIEPVHRERLQSAIEQLHHASQYIAMAGKAYLPAREDDSHTTLSWDGTTQTQWGQWIGQGKKWRLGLSVPDFALVFDIEDGPTNTFSLHLEERTNVESWLRFQLFEVDVDPMAWQWDLHYDIPDYPYDQGVPYRMPGNNILRSYAAQRELTNVVLTKIGLSPIRIWPHHFDTGALITKDNFTIGLGWAIPDSLSDTPYWYATRYPAPSNWAKLDIPGQWWEESLQGRALKVSDIWDLAEVEQFKTLYSFFQQTIDYYFSDAD